MSSPVQRPRTGSAGPLDDQAFDRDLLPPSMKDSRGDPVMMKNVTSTDVWDSLSLDLVSIQVDGRVAFINTAGARMLGATDPEQIIGKPMLDFVHPDYREVEAERARYLAKGNVWVSPSAERWVRLDGVVIQVEVAAMPVCFEGKPAMQLIVREGQACAPGGGPPFGSGSVWSRRRRYHGHMRV